MFHIFGRSTDYERNIVGIVQAAVFATDLDVVMVKAEFVGKPLHFLSESLDSARSGKGRGISYSNSIPIWIVNIDRVAPIVCADFGINPIVSGIPTPTRSRGRSGRNS